MGIYIVKEGDTVDHIADITGTGAGTFVGCGQFDETAQAPYFFYESGGICHEVRFEDVRSLQAKFDLIREFGLMGAGYWNIMQFFRANWILLQRNFNVLREL